MPPTGQQPRISLIVRRRTMIAALDITKGSRYTSYVSSLVFMQRSMPLLASGKYADAVQFVRVAFLASFVCKVNKHGAYWEEFLVLLH